MSEESIDSLVTPEKIDLGSRSISTISAERSVSPSHGRSTRAYHNRASGGSFSAGKSATRNSTGKSGSFNISQNVVSRYLRASTGSCHDHCKSGMRHSFEEAKPRAPLQKRQVKTLPIELNIVPTIEDERKHVKAFNHKPPSDTKTKSPYSKAPPDTKPPSPKHTSSSDKEKAVRHKPSADSRNDHQKPKTSLDAETSPRLKKTPLLKNKPSSSRKLSSPDPPEMIKSVIFPSESVVAKVEQGSSTASEKPRSGRKKISPSSQHSSVNSDPVKDKPVLSSGKSDVHGKERKNSDAEAGRNMTASKTSVKKILAPPASSLPPKVSPIKTGFNRSRKAENSKLVSTSEVQNGGGRYNSSASNDEKVLEKTLHVVKIEAENNIFDSISDDPVISSFSSPSSPKSDKHISDNDESLEIDSVLPIPNDLAVSLSQAESSSLLPREEDEKEIEYDDGDQGSGEFILENDDSLVIDNMQSVLDGHEVSAFLSPLSAKSEAESSSLSPHEEDNNDIKYHDEPDECIYGNDESLEIGKALAIPDNHAAVPSSPSSPRSSSSLSPHEEDNKEIENCDSGPGQFIPDEEESLEIDNLQSVSDDCNVSSLPSPVLAKPLSLHEDNKEINSHDDEPYEYISENGESPENGNMQTILDRDTILSFPSPSSPKSLSHADLPSLSPHEEHKKEIEYHDDESVEYISENDEPPEIGHMQPVPNGHTIPSLPRPSSYPEFSSLSSHGGEDDDDEEIEYIDGELDGFIPDKDEYIANGDVAPAGESDNRTLGRSRVVISEDQHRLPVKLKFKRGRVIDLQSDNHGPMRIRFRKARVHGVENGHGRLKTLKRSGSTGHIIGEELSSEKVVLKHQGIQDKKDSQILFNNVIEQTASKLVESRKSKVKALVGAFETVISLQETKPSS